MLDNTTEIIEADKLGVIKATMMLSKQCQQAWDETRSISLPESYKDIDHVIVAGMGGSHLGAQLINAVYEKELKAPLIIQNEYTLPGYVSEKTLIIATSFSGTTEETLCFLEQAAARNAKVVCISAGGPIAEIAKEKGYPYYTFESTYNPSRIPRYGSGYLFISQMAMLSKLGIIPFAETDLKRIIDVMNQANNKYQLEVETAKNPAKQLALKLQNHVVCLIASEHLAGSAYIFKNQLNESAKQFAVMFKIPELDHHLLEGLQYPDSNQNDLCFTFFESDLYYDRVQARYSITKEVVTKQGIATQTFTPQTQGVLDQAFETLVFSSFTAIYTSILNKVDPGPNPWVDFLKAQLKSYSS